MPVISYSFIFLKHIYIDLRFWKKDESTIVFFFLGGGGAGQSSLRSEGGGVEITLFGKSLIFVTQCILNLIRTNKPNKMP